MIDVIYCGPFDTPYGKWSNALVAVLDKLEGANRIFSRDGEWDRIRVYHTDPKNTIILYSCQKDGSISRFRTTVALLGHLMSIAEIIEKISLNQELLDEMHFQSRGFRRGNRVRFLLKKGLELVTNEESKSRSIKSSQNTDSLVSAVGVVKDYTWKFERDEEVLGTTDDGYEFRLNLAQCSRFLTYDWDIVSSPGSMQGTPIAHEVIFPD